MRLDQLTFTRFIAAISIVIFHYGRNVSPFNHESVSALFAQAHLGVSFFFVLSGFIMIIAYSRYKHIDALDYYKNRFARIYPLLAFSVVPYFYFLTLLADVKVSGIFLNLSTIQAWLPGNALAGNAPLWSLTVECFFFICFPFLFNHFYKKQSLTKVGEVIFIVWCLSVFVENYLLKSGFYQGFPSPGHDLIHYFPLMHLNQFLVGNLTGLLFLKSGNTRGRYDVFIILVLIMLYLLLIYPVGLNYHNGFLAVVFAPLIYFMAKNKGIIANVFSLKPLVFLGEISFGVYVLQESLYRLVQIINEKFRLISNPDVLFYAFVLFLILISAICYYYIEVPLRNRIKTIRLRPFFKTA